MAQAPESAEEDVLLAEVVSRLVRDDLGPTRLYLFGSRARGDARPDSDFDILAVVPNPREEIPALTSRAYLTLTRLPERVDVVVMNCDRFEWLSTTPSSHASNIKREGRLVYAI